MITRCPVLIPMEDGFEEPVLLKTMREAAIASRGGMTFVPGFDATSLNAERMSAWVASRKAGEVRITAYPNTVRIRRETGQRWNCVDIVTSNDEFPAGFDRHAKDEDAFKEASRIISMVSKSLDEHVNDGVGPDVSGLDALSDRIVGDARYHAAACQGRTQDAIRSMRYALASPFTPARAIASPIRLGTHRCILNDGDFELPDTVSREWDVEPFLFVNRSNTSLTGLPRIWTLSAWQFATSVDVDDPVECLRLISQMPKRLVRDLAPLL